MSSERGGEALSVDPADPVAADAAHLDEDPEALEDPVHCGDAKHQHDVHQRAAHEAG
jgi:hypothetical protein